MKPFNPEETDIKNYYYIAHLFGGILIGKGDDCPNNELIEAINNDEILEVHFFNEREEIYAVRINDKLMVYEPLEHKEVPAEQIVVRYYQLMEKYEKGQYDTLEVKEYIKYDDDNLAYVDRTVLNGLIKWGEQCEERKKTK